MKFALKAPLKVVFDTNGLIIRKILENDTVNIRNIILHYSGPRIKSRTFLFIEKSKTGFPTIFWYTNP